MAVENDDIDKGFLITRKGVPVDLTTLADISIYVYYVVDDVKMLVETYKKTNAMPTAVLLDPLVVNRCSIIISRTLTDSLGAVTLYGEIKIKATVDSKYSASLKFNGKTGLFLTELDKSANPTDTD